MTQFYELNINPFWLPAYIQAFMPLKLKDLNQNLKKKHTNKSASAYE